MTSCREVYGRNLLDRCKDSNKIRCIVVGIRSTNCPATRETGDSKRFNEIAMDPPEMNRFDGISEPFIGIFSLTGDKIWLLVRDNRPRANSPLII